MKKILLVLTASLLAVSSGFAKTPTPPPFKILPSLAPMLQTVMPAIVNVAVQGQIAGGDIVKGPNGRPRPAKPKKFQSIGSGVILDPVKGYIVTNAHVIRHASSVTITLFDGRRLKAKRIGEDEASDVAIIQIEAKNLPTIELGDSLTVKVGDFVVAVGNPFGLNNFGNNQTATFGIVSAMQRNTLNIEGVENFIQTDAAINPGNSGGALIDNQGRLIGINTAILAPFGGNIGIGFAIPINMVKDIAKQLIQFGSVHRGLMGIYVQHLTPELAQAFSLDSQLHGAIITQINHNSPAERAGLKVGDIITRINDTPITDAAQVKTVISLLRVGTTVRIKLIRNKQSLTVDAVVTDIKKHQQLLQKSNPYLYGLALRDIAEQSPIHGLITGVFVSGLSENSNGWRAGLRPGDVITHINQQRIQHLSELQSVAAKRHGEKLLLRVLRGPGSLYLILK